MQYHQHAGTQRYQTVGTVGPYQGFSAAPMSVAPMMAFSAGPMMPFSGAPPPAALQKIDYQHFHPIEEPKHPKILFGATGAIGKKPVDPFEPHNLAHPDHQKQFYRAAYPEQAWKCPDIAVAPQAFLRAGGSEDDWKALVSKSDATPGTKDARGKTVAQYLEMDRVQMLWSVADLDEHYRPTHVPVVGNTHYNYALKILEHNVVSSIQQTLEQPDYDPSRPAQGTTFETMLAPIAPKNFRTMVVPKVNEDGTISKTKTALIGPTSLVDARSYSSAQPRFGAYGIGSAVPYGTMSLQKV